MTELSSLGDRTRNLDNKLEDTSHRMNRLLYGMDRPTPLPAAADSLANASHAAENADAAPGDPFDPKAVYDAAYLDYSKGNLDLALQGFRHYLRAFPESEFADNSQYWIGEIYYAKADYITALSEFQQVILNYPKGAKVPAATLKIGMCRLKLHDPAGAKRYFDVLVEQFPDTEEAAMAKRQLQGLPARK